MKVKNIVSVLIISVMCLALIGCSDKSVHEDLLNYSNNELPKIVDIETEVADGYDSISGTNYTDDETMYNALLNEIIPASTELIAITEGIIPDTKEVRDIHDIYISSINNQHSAFVIMISALENQDYDQINSANEKLETARKESRDFLVQLKELGEDNNVVFD